MFLVFAFAVNYNSEILKFIEFLDAAALVVYFAFSWGSERGVNMIHFVFSIETVN